MQLLPMKRGEISLWLLISGSQTGHLKGEGSKMSVEYQLSRLLLYNFFNVMYHMIRR